MPQTEHTTKIIANMLPLFHMTGLTEWLSTCSSVCLHLRTVKRYDRLVTQQDLFFNIFRAWARNDSNRHKRKESWDKWSDFRVHGKSRCVDLLRKKLRKERNVQISDNLNENSSVYRSMKDVTSHMSRNSHVKNGHTPNWRVRGRLELPNCWRIRAWDVW